MQPEFSRHIMFSLTGKKPEQLSIVGFVDGSKNESVPQVFIQGNLRTDGNERFRAVPLLSINSARLLGHEVPDALIVYSGEVFYKNGLLDEVRLFGFYIVKESDPAGGTHLRKWATPKEPTFSLVDGKGLELHASDKGRAHIAYSEEPGGPYIEWDLGIKVFRFIEPTHG